MEEAKSEMSILGEDAKFIDTPLASLNPHPSFPLIAEAPFCFFKLLPVEISMPPPRHLLPSLHTKGGCPGSEGVAVLKYEGLCGAAPGADLRRRDPVRSTGT